MPIAVTTPDARPSKLSDGSPGLRALGVPGSAGPLFELALTHRSFAFEQTDGGDPRAEHNERLEFLGDAVLGVVVTDLIYRRFPDSSEGDMARLRASVVNTHALADVARSLEIGDHIRLGKGEEASGGRDKASLLADTFEALVGAVYLERGIEVVADHLVPLFSDLVDDSAAARERYDAKTALQEVAVRLSGNLPSYRVSSSGPDHEKSFSASVLIGGKAYGDGTGRSKKEAEQQAARQALSALAREGEDPTTGGGADDARAS